MELKSSPKLSGLYKIHRQYIFKTKKPFYVFCVNAINFKTNIHPAMPILKKGIVLCLSSVLLLHVFIRHQHHGEMSLSEHKQAHVQARDVLDHIGLAFHQDPLRNLDHILPEEEVLPLVKHHVYPEKNASGRKESRAKVRITAHSFWASVSVIYSSISHNNGLRAPPIIFQHKRKL